MIAFPMLILSLIGLRALGAALRGDVRRSSARELYERRLRSGADG